MKNEIQVLINTLFWEKYFEVISEYNHKEYVKEFHKALGVMIPSVVVSVHPEKAMDLHATVFVVQNLIVKI